MNVAGKGLLLRVQQGGRLTIPYKDATRLGIKDGDHVIVRIEKAVIRSETEVKGE